MLDKLNETIEYLNTVTLGDFAKACGLDPLQAALALQEAGKTAKGKAPTKATKGKRGRMTTEELAQLDNSILKAMRAGSFYKVDVLSTVVGVSTPLVSRRLQAMWGKRYVRTQGKGRSMTWSKK